MVEPIQGEAGDQVPSEDCLSKGRAFCTRHNVLFCADEIQTGLGRTGKLFCYDHAGVRPDIVIMGKALSGGFYPVSAIACDDQIMHVFEPGIHGSTYGGNPLGSAIGIAALDVIINENLPSKAECMGEYLISLLKKIDHPMIREVRGKGLLIAIEFNQPVAKKFCKALKTRGLLAKDTHAVTVRFAPPLVITQEQIEEAFGIIRATLEEF
jgi:ornithine--oxo-acid transaminase